MVNNPNLQIQILELFTVHGTCSRKGVLSALQRDDYGNIHDTMSRMESRRLIASDHDSSGKGRPEKFFRMTTIGFEWMLRMQRDMKPSKFWELILGFVYQYPTDPHYIESLITDFIKRHITYHSAHKLFFILDKINDFCTNLILTKICSKGREISLEQRLFETIAINPNISVSQLSSLISLKRSPDIKSILNRYSNSLDRYDLLIMEKNTFGKEEYKLSLLGVLIVLTLIRWNDLGKLPNGLYHSQFSFSEYADKVVGSYKKKLSLVFENWSILRDYLEIYAIYHLDVILDKDLRQKYIRRSIVSDGIEEYHDLAKAMASRAQYQMSVLIMDGFQTCLNFIESMAIRNSLDISKFPESRKLVKLKIEVVYDAIQKMNLYVNPFIQTDEIDESIKRYLMEVREDILSTEIAFFYYFFMFRNDHFRFSAPSKLREHDTDIDDALILFTCRYYVPKVVYAPMVKEFLSGIIKDISTHHEIVRRELEGIGGFTS